MGAIVGLIVIVILGWFGYNQFFNNNDKPWWNGTENQTVCVTHNPLNDSCFTAPVTVEDERITWINLPISGLRAIGLMDCGKAVTFEGRYCVIEDIGGRNQWQVQSN